MHRNKFPSPNSQVSGSEDITPTWLGALPFIHHLYTSPKTRENAERQLRRMAEAADSYDASQRKKGDTFELLGDAVHRVIAGMGGDHGKE
jgi:hypothetical protein